LNIPGRDIRKTRDTESYFLFYLLHKLQGSWKLSLLQTLKFYFSYQRIREVCFNVFFQTTVTERSAIASELFSFPSVEDIKKSAGTGKILGRRIQTADKAFFLDLHTTCRGSLRL
jgi:hypothetical protein